MARVPRIEAAISLTEKVDAEIDLAAAAARADEQVRILKSRVREALLAGSDTAVARAALAVAAAEAAVVAERQADAAAAAAGARDQRLDDVARSLAEAARHRFASQFTDDGDDPMAAVEFDKHDPAILQACSVLAQAKDDIAAPQEALARAEAECLNIATRISVHDDRYAAIVTRRHLGDHRSNDAAELYLIAADREGLIAERDAAAENLAVARVAHDAARAEVQRAQAALQKAERDTQGDAIIENLKKLDERFVAMVAQFNSVAPPGFPAWGASSALRDAIRKLAVRRHEV